MPYSFKIDENLPIEIAQLLREAGFDALTVYDQELTGQTDEHVIRLMKAFSVEELNGRLWIVDENQIKVRE